MGANAGGYGNEDADDDGATGPGGADYPDADVDPAELQDQLDQIKGAMGLEDQYPGRAGLWLVAGVLVGLAGILVQATYFYNETLSEEAYAAIWGGFLVVAIATVWITASRLPAVDRPPNAPGWRAVFGSLFAFLVVLSSLGGRIAEFAPGLERATFFFGSLIAAIGLALLLTGAVLAAYHVRRRDRLAFYAGGLWVLAFAFVFPHVQLLRWIGIGLFGVCFLLYAVASWAYLRE